MITAQEARGIRQNTTEIDLADISARIKAAAITSNSVVLPKCYYKLNRFGAFDGFKDPNVEKALYEAGYTVYHTWHTRLYNKELIVEIRW